VSVIAPGVTMEGEQLVCQLGLKVQEEEEEEEEEEE
jgi:hypothetical protein